MLIVTLASSAMSELSHSAQLILEAASLCTNDVQGWIGVVLNARHDFLNLLVSEPSGSTDCTDWQIEEGCGRCYCSRVAVGEARNKLRLLAPQVLGEMDQTCQNH